MAKTQYKDPDETISIVIDWTSSLVSGDTISSASWSVPAGVTNVGESDTTTTTTIVVAGGTAGTSYLLTCTVLTAVAVETLEETIILRVADSSAMEPVSLDEVKEHLRIDSDDTGDDSYILALIQAAREYCEDIQNRSYLSKTKTLTLDGFPAGHSIILPYPPLSSVTSITYKDTAGASQTFSSASYVVDTSNEPGRISLAHGYTWPATLSEINTVTITYVAGYGTIEDVPEVIKLAIKMLVAHWYERRLPIITGTIVADTPVHLKALLGYNRMANYA